MSGISRTSAIGIASDGEFGGLSANTQSLLSTLATPPKMKGAADGFALAVIGWVVGGLIYMVLSEDNSKTAGFIVFLIISLAATAGGVALQIANNKWNKWEYPPVYRKWKHSWLCKRCGATWVRAD
jgi:dipeptide/tripeptide permease